MMPTYSFNGSNNVKAPSGSKTLAGSALALAGLDLTTPVDMLTGGKTPFAKNFRLYAQQADSRKVAVSSRKGAGYFMEAVGQTNEFIQDATTGAATTTVGIISGVQGVRFQASTANRITRIDLKPSDPAGGTRGELLVEIWSDNAGIPYKKLATSSISSGSIGATSAWLPARFINAVKLTTSSYYWVIVRMQDDGIGAYTLDTTTAYTSYKTDSTINGLTIQTSGINIKVYGTPTGTFKGGYRFLRDNGTNTTMVAYGTTMYYLDKDNILQSILTGLDTNATIYRFAHADNKVFWVNGYDTLRAWDGTFESTNPNLVSNGTFEVDSNGWLAEAYYNSTIARTTTQFHTGVASLSITNTGTMAANCALTLNKNHRYRIKISVKVSTGGNVNIYGITSASTAYVNGAVTKIGSDIAATTSWQDIDFYYDGVESFIGIQIRGASGVGTIYIDDVSITDTGMSYIIDPELEIASDIIFNKDRLWTRTANDTNKLQWCEEPGNPTARTSPVDGTQIATNASDQWYNSWRSIDNKYVPRPHNGSPVVDFIGFQNAITVFTQDKKYIIDGYDSGSYTMRESTGSKGAISTQSVAVDENSVWFVAKDGFYKYDGSSDVKISGAIAPIFDACPNKDDIRPVVWKNQVRFYMATTGSAYNNICMIYDKELEEWMMDTDVFVKDALWLTDTNDSQDLLEFSSLVPQIFEAEVDYNNLGAPIDFEYRFNYDSMKSPGQKKRIKRFVPLLQGVDTSFPITIAMDKDFQDSPKIKKLLLTVNGAVLDDFVLGDGTILGGSKSFKPKRQSYSGYANYWQFRLIRNAVNNRVAFVGAQYTYKTKRL